MRVKLVNANFPLRGPDSTDAYFAAFKIPDLFFFTLAAGALGVAFIPFLNDRLQKHDRRAAWELSNSLMNLLTIVMLVVGIILFVFADPLLRAVAPTMSPEQMHNGTTIMRLIAFNPVLFSISAIITSVQQTLGRFFFYALAPLIYNASIIVSAIVFSEAHARGGGPGHLGLIGLGVGALVGAILQLLVAVLGFVGLGYKYKTIINLQNPDFRQMLKQLPPRSLDQGIDSLNSIVETRFARQLGEGNLTNYENAYVLQNTPTMLIGTTISTAAFPRLTERLSQGRTDLFRKEFLQILRTMIWLIMPVVVVCYFSRGYLARVIFASGAPDIAIIFGFFTAAILFRTIYSIISRWFYAQKDTRTPLFVSLFAIALNIILAYKLSRPWAYGIEGLAMAQSIVAAAEVVILGIVMVIRDPKLLNAYLLNGIYKIVSITGFTVVAAFCMLSILPLQRNDVGFMTLGTKLGAITFVTFVVYIGMSALFGLEEVRPIFRKLRKLMLAPVKFYGPR
jgi:putative peptidoglycan lipid II flippase